MSNENQQPNNSVLEVKLDYIQKDIKVIKEDVKEIKNDYLTRREFGDYRDEVKEIYDDHELRMRDQETFISNLKGKYVILAIIGMALLSITISIVGTTVAEKIKDNNCPVNFICTSK